MGKVRKLRHKYHLSALKNKSLQNLPESTDGINELEPKKSIFKSSENIFAGIDISFDELAKSLPKDFDARSVISTKSRKELKEEERFLKKKERRKLRHERFLQKLEFTYKTIHKPRFKNKNKKEPSSIGSILSEASSPVIPGAPISMIKNLGIKSKPRGILKAKDRLKQQKQDIMIFKKIVGNKKFRTNPFETITKYLKQKFPNDN